MWDINEALQFLCVIHMVFSYIIENSKSLKLLKNRRTLYKTIFNFFFKIDFLNFLENLLMR